MLARLAPLAALAVLSVLVPSAAVASTAPEPSATALVHTPATAHPEPTAVYIRSHRAVDGDTLWWLAARYCGSPLLFSRLAANNHVRNPDRIYAGTVYKMDCRRAGAQGTPARSAARRTASPARVTTTSGWVYPLSSRGTCTSGYGHRVIYLNDGTRYESFHQGVDISAPYGRTIRAVAAGTVVSAGWNSGYGRQVVVRHGRSSWTAYNHASSLLVGTGQRVGRGQAVARVGSTGFSTGNHLHVEVWTGWKHRTSPMPAFRAHGVRLC